MNTIGPQLSWKHVVSKEIPIRNREVRLQQPFNEICGFTYIEPFCARVYKHINHVCCTELEFKIRSWFPILFVDPYFALPFDLIRNFSEGWRSDQALEQVRKTRLLFVISNESK